jgi:hypothetical protein
MSLPSVVSPFSESYGLAPIKKILMMVSVGRWRTFLNGVDQGLRCQGAGAFSKSSGGLAKSAEEGAAHGFRIANDGGLVRDWCRNGHGITRKSVWDVEADLKAGTLVELLEEFSAGSTGLQIVYPATQDQPKRVRLLIERIAEARQGRKFRSRFGGGAIDVTLSQERRRSSSTTIITGGVNFEEPVLG